MRSATVQTVPISTILRLIDSLTERRFPASICPSEVARALCANQANWRALMPAVREAARKLAREGRLVITQRGKVLSPDKPFTGAIRLQTKR
jgi:Protein of unknown function (DUF3253)